MCEVASRVPAREVKFRSGRGRLTLQLQWNVGAFDGPSGAGVRRGHTFHGLPPMANYDGPSGAGDSWTLRVSYDDPAACFKDHSEASYRREACSALSQTSRAYRFMSFHSASNEKHRNRTQESYGRPSIIDRPCELLSSYFAIIIIVTMIPLATTLQRARPPPRSKTYTTSRCLPTTRRRQQRNDYSTTSLFVLINSWYIVFASARVSVCVYVRVPIIQVVFHYLCGWERW